MPSAELQLYQRTRIPLDLDSRVWITDRDGEPRPTTATRGESTLNVSWSGRSSGYLQLPWRLNDGSEMVLSTATIGPCEVPFVLAVELARGVLVRVMNWAQDWLRSGLELSPAIQESLTASNHSLALAAIRQHDPVIAEHHAIRSLEETVLAQRLLVQNYIGIIVPSWSQSQSAPRPILGWGAGYVGTQWTSRPATKVQLTSVPMGWADLMRASGELDCSSLDLAVRSAETSGTRLLAGPFVTAQARSYPAIFGNDPLSFSSMLHGALAFARSLVQRYRGRVAYWNVTSGCNVPEIEAPADGSGGNRLWTPEERLQLSAALIETVQQADPNAAVLLTIEQTWGEYLGIEDYAAELPPKSFADTLVRAGLGLRYLGLRFELGDGDRTLGSPDPLTWLRILDRFAALGLPLIVFLHEAPTRNGEARARSASSAESLSERNVSELLLLLACQRCIHAVIWEPGWVRRSPADPTIGHNPEKVPAWVQDSFHAIQHGAPIDP